MTTITRLESNVRSYCRAFPTTFAKAKGSVIEDDRGRRYIDFFAGAGSLNYGHNPEVLKEELLAYVAGDGISHALDLTTEAKVAFLDALQQNVLGPRSLDYKVMFPGPTGTNAVESALKIARKATGRSEVIAFTNAFHGMTLGSLALTGNGGKRGGAGVTLGNVSRMPFDGYMGAEFDTANYLDVLLSDTSSGVPLPAAVIVETVQGEGGINVASAKWLRSLQRVAHKHGALLIIDDIQVGCGRMGDFFSFEEAGLRPDIVTLSKSLSGYGLPLAITMMHRDLDVLAPGEHNGTFRGNNLAFVTARAALEHFWSDDAFTRDVQDKSSLLRQRLQEMAGKYQAEYRGRGFLQGLAFSDASIPGAASAAAFERGLVIETSGAKDEVLKVLAPLTIARNQLEEGLAIVDESLQVAFEKADAASPRKRDKAAAQNGTAVFA